MDKIYIVGGGASGMMAAMQAKTKDNEVTFLKKRPGWKENSRNRKREV